METNPVLPLPSTAMEGNIPALAEMVEITLPSPLAEMVETTPPPPQSVRMADTETQTEGEDRDSPERERKKTSARVTEAEILRDSSEDSNNISLELTDDEEEQDIGGREGGEVTKSDKDSDLKNARSCEVRRHLSSADIENKLQECLALVNKIANSAEHRYTNS